MDKQIIIIGAGIAGLAMALAQAKSGNRVIIIDKDFPVVGASIRNFGMVWPIGQPKGEMRETALLSKNIWKEVCESSGIWFDEVGSLHMAYAADEWKVLQELETAFADNRIKLLNASDTLKHSSAVNPVGLKGSLFSDTEIIIDPREAIRKLPSYLEEVYGVNFIWGKRVTSIEYLLVHCGNEKIRADHVIICNGADFVSLYPEHFAMLPITKCKLQMMRMKSQPSGWRIGPALCGPLSLGHYKSFEAAPSLSILKKRFENEYADYLRWGIHVMVSQNQQGEITAGDSHEYGPSHDPFDRQFINNLVLDYLSGFARFKDETIIETWNGTYAKLTNGESFVIKDLEPGVSIFNGLGGAGMTLSFGLAEKWALANR